MPPTASVTCILPSYHSEGDSRTADTRIRSCSSLCRYPSFGWQVGQSSSSLKTTLISSRCLLPLRCSSPGPFPPSTMHRSIFLPIAWILLTACDVVGASPAAASISANATGAITGVFSYSDFSYTAQTTSRYATALPSPLPTSSGFAPAFSQASTLLPGNLTYTTYSLNPNATLTNDGTYGQSAYAALWANISYSTAPPFTTTVEPTPVASGELVYPPTLYNSPSSPNDTKLPADFIWGVAGSSWQIEGGLQLEGRGPSILDV